mmetsp:Transcript_26381/g.47365  ORF Transcript_26381/g.47365 Transcript_26381/m.47365 type:complete len:297 (-) Transcript_26381:36-926(-)
MEPCTGSIRIAVGEVPAEPATWFEVSVKTGKGVPAEIAALTSTLGEFNPLQLYGVIRAVSSEAAQELAELLTSIWEIVQNEESLRIGLMLRPNPAGPPLGSLTFRARDDMVIMKAGPNDNLTSVVKCGINVQAGVSIKILDEEASLRFEAASQADLPTLFQSRNPGLALGENARLLFEFLFSQSFFTKVDLALKKFKVPQDQYNSFAFLRLLAREDFALNLDTLEHVPKKFKETFELPPGAPTLQDMLQTLGPQQKQTIEKIGELSNGSIELYTHFRVLAKISIKLTGLSQLVNQN